MARSKIEPRHETEKRAWRPTDGLTYLLLFVMVVACARWWIVSPALRSELTPRPTGFLVPVNSADAAALSLLPGIGPRTAEFVIEEREAGGPFVDADDMDRVYRIGPKTIARLRDHVRFDTPEPRETPVSRGAD